MRYVPSYHDRRVTKPAEDSAFETAICYTYAMSSEVEQTERRINDALRIADTTRKVIIGSGAVARTPSCFAESFGSRPAVVVADRNTYRAGGEGVMTALDATGGMTVRRPLVIEADDLRAEYRFVEMVAEFIRESDAVPIAVGSGTINDLVKLAASQCGRPYMVVATAASMDGYTAFGASITKDNYKQTIFCPAPVALIADMGIIEKAPEGMNASGYADLIAKIPAGADWMVADALGIEPIHRSAWSLVQPNLREWISDPEGVRRGDRASLVLLIEGLIMSGLAMQVAQSSRPASGADHLFSHLWDNEHHVHNGIAPSHGVKVGIGAICSEAFYECILALKREDIRSDEDSVAPRWPSWEWVKSHVAETFSDPLLASQAIAQCEKKYVDVATLSSRLERLRSIWYEMSVALRKQLIGAEIMRDMVARAGAASTPEEIGIDSARLRRSFDSARLLRQRHTVLDLAFEMGVWHASVDSLFAPGGFWRKT